MDKKTLWLLIGGLGGIILLILILVLLNKLTQKEYLSYEKVELKLVNAAEKYYNDNQNLLPNVEGGTSTVTLTTLVNGEYIKPLNKYLKDGDSCDARVVVTKYLSYDYVPYLNCGENYLSTELYKKVLTDNTITNTGAGLYNMGNEKVFRGEVKNNYIMLNDKLWRIARIDENNNLVLISNFRTESYEWDNRYNQEIDLDYGINNYNLSRIKETIENDYYNGELLTDKEKSKVVPTKACIGLRKNDESGSYKIIECKELTEKEVPIRLLTVGEYLEASIDPYCKTLEDKGCINYNYIHDLLNSFWTITKGQKNSSYVYNITSSGVSETRTNSAKQVRYVINLGTKTIYSTGSGTYEDPYKIR